MRLIVHIADRARWQAAKASGTYDPGTLDTEGFVHCSEISQVEQTANAFFTGVENLILLVINTELLEPELKYEEGVKPLSAKPRADSNEPAGAALFPHIYGPINTDAVIQEFAFVPDGDGRFSLPQDLAPRP